MPFALDEKYLRSAEEKLGAKLPDSYRRATMAASGGEVASNVEHWYLYTDHGQHRQEASCTHV